MRLEFSQQIFIKIHPVEAELFYYDRQTGLQTWGS